MQMAGTDDISIVRVQKDASDNVYVLGEFHNTVDFGTTNYTTRGNRDGFIAKYDSDGNFVWARQIGGANKDIPEGLHVKGSDVYITGRYKAAITFDGGGALNDFDDYDVFLVKYDANGNYVWVKRIAWGPDKEKSGGVTVDNLDNIIIDGSFSDSLYFEGDTLYFNTTTRHQYYAKFDSDGDFIWANGIRGTGTSNSSNQIFDVDYTDVGTYLSGWFTDSIIFPASPDSIKFESVGLEDLVFAKIDDNGNVIWARQGGSTSLDRCYDVDADDFGNLYFTGYISTGFKIDSSAAGALDSRTVNTNGGWDQYLAKYSFQGLLLWLQNIGSTGPDIGYGVDVFENLIAITGYFSDTVVFGGDTLGTTGPTDQDVVIGILTLDGEGFAAASWQGTVEDKGQGIVQDGKGGFYTGGYFESNTLSDGTITLTNADPGNSDGFLAKWKTDFEVAWTDWKHVTCNGGNDGELTVTPFFGTSPYTYEWSHDAGLNDSTTTNRAAGNYGVKVTDFNGYSDSIGFEIVEPDAIVITFDDVTDVQCYNGSNGAIDISVTGGNPPYTYFWDGPYGFTETTQDISGLRAGTYNIEVTDINGCTGNNSQVIDQPDPFIFAPVVTDILRPPGSNGAIDLNVTGGTPGYTYLWSGPDVVNLVPTAEDQTGLDVGGDYDVTVTDSEGCTGDTTIFLGDNTAFLASIDSFVNVSCFGGVDGYIRVTTTGGTALYSYAWTDAVSNPVGENSPELTGVPAGKYYVTVTDGDSKTADASKTLTEPSSAVAASLVQVINVNCFGDCDGSIDISVTGGTAPYSYSWTGPDGFTDSTQDVDSLCAGFYSVTVTDVNGCTDLIPSIEVEEPDALFGDIDINQGILCYGDQTGILEANPGGGTPPYTYDWNDPASQNTKRAVSLPPGTWTVTITDNAGCEIQESETLLEPTEISITLTSKTNVACYGDVDGGSITVNVSGGTGIPAYEWYDSLGNFITATKNLIDVGPNIYTLIVTDANNCQKNYTDTITEPPALYIDHLDTDVTCNGGNDGAIDITAGGGTPLYSYAWDDGPTTEDRTGITAGDYTVTVTDFKGCTQDSTFTITEPLGMIINYMVTDATCKDSCNGSIDISVTNGTPPIIINWDHGPTTEDVSGLCAGDYTVTVTDDDGCSVDSTFTVSEPEALVINHAEIHVSCRESSDGTIDLTVTGGTALYVYSWDDGPVTEDRSALPAGDYTVTVVDDNGCSADSTITITEPSPIVINHTEIDVSCNSGSDGSIDITVSGGTAPYTYSWDDGPTSEDRTGLSAGIYTVDVDDANDCGPVASGSIIIVEPDSLYIDSISVTNTFTGQSIGEIKVYALGGTGSLDFSIDNGDTYQSDSTFTGLSAGIYVIVVKDANGCTKTTQKEVEELSPIPEIYDAFTPNLDGVNDYWNIYYLDLLYPNCIVKVYSTWGTLVFSSNGYPEPWDGTKNGTELPAGTYIYVIDLGDGSDPMTGTVNIIK